MSNQITAYFKGRAGVAESVYQYDYGKILIIDGLNLPATFEVHFTTASEDDAVTVLGQNNRVAIPDSCLSIPGIVTAYIYLHTGENDGETEYVVRFAVNRRARPDYDASDEERTELETAIQTAIAMLQNPKKVNQPLDEYNQVDYGTAGQLLRTKGNGSTEWSDVGLPTDEQTAQAVSDWLDEHPEATTTVEDGAITTQKLSANLKNTIVPLSKFNGSTDGERLYTALITDNFKGTILGGNIVINSPIPIPNVQIREVKIANATITLNDDMFVAEADNIVRLPSFVNCKFIGNGNAITGGNYNVFGDFIGCSFDDCALINDATGTAQSAYLANCEVLNNTVSLIKACNLYDCRITNMLCESQNATLVDTFDSTGGQGGPRSLWVSNSMFEGFQSTVFKLAGGGPTVRIRDCYFEANVDGCMKLKKSAEGYDILFLEISGCKVNSPVTPFEISDFTDNYRVKVSIHDNYYYTSVIGTPMVSGIPVDNDYAVYNNCPTYTTDIISDAARYIYEPGKLVYPTVDTTRLQIRAGGWTQIGQLVFFDLNVKALVTQAGTNSSIMTGLPKPSVQSVSIPIVSGSDGTETNKSLYITTEGVATLYNGITEDEIYRIKGFYFTSNKTVR